MQQRSLGITVLTFLTVMLGLYCFMAGVALLYGGAIGAFAGADLGHVVWVLGAVFVGLTVSAYATALGIWLGRSWAWASGNVVFVVAVIANLILSVLASNFINILLPSIAALIAVWYLRRPEIRSVLLDSELTPVPAAQAAPPQSVEGAKTAA